MVKQQCLQMKSQNLVWRSPHFQGLELSLHVCHVALDLCYDLFALSRDRNRVGNQLTEHLLHSRDPVDDLCWVPFLSGLYCNQCES